MTGRAHDGPPVTGDQVRDTGFLRPHGNLARGYDVAEVDELLRLMAAELDAGRQVGPMIEKAEFRFRMGTQAYETPAADWFLEMLRCREDRSELAQGSDPWRDLPVANYFTRGDLASGPATPPQRGHRKGRARDREYLALECAAACRDFGQQPGTALRWVVTPGRRPYSFMRAELHTPEQQTVASVRTRSVPMLRATVSTGGRTFTWRRVTRSARPGLAELVRRSDLDYGELPQAGRLDRAVRMLFPPVPIRELLDETGTPILYATGQHYDYGAGAYITFPDERWLKFPVRSTEMENAIMTAVDQAGNRVARYRSLPVPGPLGCEITVHPGQQLTTELVLALVVSAPWLHSYFESSGGGG